MKLERFEIQQLTGVDRNKPKGRGETQPHRLYNVAFDRTGGWSVMGQEENLHTLSGTILGYDDTGIVSLLDTGKYRLYDGTTSFLQANAAYPSPSKGSHIPECGMYANRTQFMVFDSNGVVVEPFTYDVSIASNTKVEEITLATIAGSGTLDVDRATGEILATGSGNIYKSVDDGETWQTITPTGDWTGGTNLIKMRRNNTAWVGFDSFGFIWRSTDGIAWTETSSTGIIGGPVTASIDHDDGSTWIITDGSSADVYVSYNDGVTWIAKTILGLSSGIDYSPKLSRWFATEEGETSANSKTNCLSSIDADEWTVRELPGDFRWRGVRTNSKGEHVVWGFSLDYTSPRIATSLTGEDGSWNEGTTGSVGIKSFITDGVKHKDRIVLWNISGNLYYSDTVTAWKSLDTPQVTDAVILSNGDVVFIGTRSGVRTALKYKIGNDVPAGQYEVYAVTYVNTKAGKLVTHIKKVDFVFATDEGNSITVVAPANPITSTELKTEVYIKFAKRTVDESGEVVLIDMDLRDAVLWKVLDPGDTEVLKEALVTNRVLPDQGKVGTLGYNGPASLHSGRVWAVPSKTEADYFFIGEDTDLSLLTQDNSILFSERGYINLGTTGSQEIVTPNLTAIVSSAIGLMFFTKLETFVLNGDIASNDLTIQKFPDVIGCDPNVIPTQLGSVVFVIWNGEVYAIVGNQSQKVFSTVWNPANKFIQVVADVPRKDVIALTSSETERIWRLDVDASQVSNNVILSANQIFPNPNGTRYRYTGSNQVSQVAEPTSPPAPVMDYRDVDLGDPTRRDNIRRIRLTVDNYTPGTAPKLYYDLIDSHPDISTQNAGFSVDGVQKEEEVIFTLPLGLHSRKFSFRIVMNDMVRASIVEPRIVVEYIPGRKFDS